MIGLSNLNFHTQNNFICGSSSLAFSASNSFSMSFDNSKTCGLRVEEYLRWLCRIVATKVTYSLNLSGVISCKFSICGA